MFFPGGNAGALATGLLRGALATAFAAAALGAGLAFAAPFDGRSLTAAGASLPFTAAAEDRPLGALAIAFIFEAEVASTEVRPTGTRAIEVFTAFVGARGVPPTTRRVPASPRFERGSDFFDFAEVARLALGTCMAVLWGSWSGLDRGAAVSAAVSRLSTP